MCPGGTSNALPGSLVSQAESVVSLTQRCYALIKRLEPARITLARLERSTEQRLYGMPSLWGRKLALGVFRDSEPSPKALPESLLIIPRTSECCSMQCTETAWKGRSSVVRGLEPLANTHRTKTHQTLSAPWTGLLRALESSHGTLAAALFSSTSPVKRAFCSVC